MNYELRIGSLLVNSNLYYCSTWNFIFFPRYARNIQELNKVNLLAPIEVEILLFVFQNK
jgi:hypothetical protein